MIRNAGLADIAAIMDIIRATVAEMKSYGNTQWDEDYPHAGDFIRDIEEGSLFVAERMGTLVGFVALNRIEPEEYKGLNWSRDRKALVVHRLAVHPMARQNGIGSELMAFADIWAIAFGLDYLKTDTYSLNSGMDALLTKAGYHRIGKMLAWGKPQPFFCYEKSLEPSAHAFDE